MDQEGTVQVIVREISNLLAPLASIAEEGPEGVIRFSRQAGVDFTHLLDGDQTEEISAFISTFAGLYNSFKDIVESESLDMTQIAEILTKIPQLIQTIYELDELSIATDAPEELAEIGQRFINYLIIEYLANYHRRIYCSFLLAGIIDDSVRDGHIYPSVNFGIFSQLFDSPSSIFRDIYGWGTSELNVTIILMRLLCFFKSFNVAAELVSLADDERMEGIDDELNLPYEQLRLPLYEIEREGTPARLGVSVVGLKASDPLSPGLGITLFGAAEISETIELNDDWNLILKGSLDILAPWGAAIRPEGFFVSEIGGISAPATINFKVTAERRAASGEKIILFGEPQGTRLELDTIGFGAGINISDKKDLFFEFLVKELALVISGGQGDGFISTILPQNGIKASFDLTTGISSDQGFYFKGSGTLEVNIPVRLSIGPIEIQSIYIVVPLSGPSFPIELSSSIATNLGVLSASVDRIGFIADLDFSKSDGNLGLANLDIKFKPPNGVGLSIDAGVVSGGGYLYLDFEKEEYAGILELDLQGILRVTAVGLITTKMPDGSKGFSLLLIITAEFGAPIQLSYGFTLSGVGGLLGLNRTMRLELIATGIRDGGINSIMFPRNVIANAPRIISDLKNYFPVEEGTFLIGPMVKIGWGTPNLVTVSLCVIIEIPGNIAILGILKLALPDEDVAIVVIQANFIGAIEFDKKRLWFFAALFESRILFIPLEGEMGLLVGWGDEASFVLSVGGFHPAFTPPPLPFGSVARIAISILNTDVARIRVEAYIAVCSNCAMFGAKAELFFGLSAFKIDGHLIFDALFRFSPFYFIINISASLSVKVFGIGLFSVRMRGSLEGPTPWHVEGTGSISLLFLDIDVDFSRTWGNEPETTLPPINVMPLLMSEFQKMENWLAVLPANNQLMVSLRGFKQGATDLILHPVGSLKISQRAVPLGMTIDKVGNQKTADANHFDVTVSTLGIEEKGDVEEPFAVGQYFTKSDNELLNAKAFEPMKSGVELSVAGEQFRAPKAVKRVVRYEKIIIDTHFRRFTRPFFSWFGPLFSLFLNGNAVSQSELSHQKRKKLKPFAEKVQVGKTSYTVAFNHDNTAFNGQAINFTSQTQAQDFMKRQIACDANLAKQLHVIPQVEMQEAA